MIGRKQRLMNQYWLKAKSLVLVISGYMLNQGEKIVATHHEYNRPSVITIVTKDIEFVDIYCSRIRASKGVFPQSKGSFSI